MSTPTRPRISRGLPLTVRMLLVAVLTPLSVLALLAAVVIYLPNHFLGGLAIALAIGVAGRVIAHIKHKPPPGTLLTEGDDPALFAIVDRLCVLADIARPQLVLSAQRQPNSWVVHLPGRAPRLYVTTGLHDLLTREELEAVLGHELAHIVNRDALVMSVVGLPGSVMLGARGGGVDAFFLIAIGFVSEILTSILSRYRELAADAGSAAITGRPSALASALLKVSESLTQVPTKDLRAAATMNAFNLVAVAPARRRGRRGWRGARAPFPERMIKTHPPLQSRIDALHVLERAQHVRRA